jgi:hypothetical protein
MHFRSCFLLRVFVTSIVCKLLILRNRELGGRGEKRDCIVILRAQIRLIHTYKVTVEFSSNSQCSRILPMSIEFQECKHRDCEILRAQIRLIYRYTVTVEFSSNSQCSTILPMSIELRECKHRDCGILRAQIRLTHRYKVSVEFSSNSQCSRILPMSIEFRECKHWDCERNVHRIHNVLKKQT